MSQSLTRQGSLDGFCGIYCAAHVIARSTGSNYGDKIQTAFFQLLRAAEQCNPRLLTAAKIAGPARGFNDKEISEIFNKSPMALQAGLIACNLRRPEAKRYKLNRFPKSFNADRASLIFKEGENHWIALDRTGPERVYECYDPWQVDPVQTRKRVSWKFGILVLPKRVWDEVS